MCEGHCKYDGVTVQELIEEQVQTDIGLAMELLQEGFRVRRACWPEHEWLKYQDNLPPKIIYPAPEGCDGAVEQEPYILYVAATCRPWEPRQADLLATDWVVIG